MSKEDIKNEINKVIDGLSIDALQELLTHARQLEERYSVDHLDHEKLEAILSEDEELLKKLAQ